METEGANMPSTPTPNLGLVLNLESDDFILGDFLTNWGLIDSSPGIEIVSALPGSGAYHGQVVFLTTTNLLYAWDATHWRLVSQPTGWTFTGSPAHVITNGQDSGSPYVAATITFSTNFTSWVMIWFTVDVHIDDVAGKNQGFGGACLIDGTQQVGLSWNNQHASSSVAGGVNYPSNTQAFNLTSGSHTLKVEGWKSDTTAGNEAVTMQQWNVNILSFTKGSGSE